jgi:phytoene desaturase
MGHSHTFRGGDTRLGKNLVSVMEKPMKRSGSASPNVTVIGAGPGGLASAMLLASAGCDVTIVERSDRVGGRCSTLESDGFRFDMGPTFFLYPEVLRSIFAMCGRRLDQEVELMRLDPHYRLFFGSGEQLEASPVIEKMEREIARLAPEDAANLRSYLSDNRRKLDAFRSVLESPFSGVSDVLRLPLMKLAPLLRPWASVDSDLKRFFKDPRIRLAFTFQSKYLGMSPFQCPSLFTILSFLEYEYGVLHPRGGCGAVSEAMARVAREMGVRFKMNEPVQRILFEGRRAVGVKTLRGVERCDALVVNADFAHAMTHLVPDRLRRRWTDRKIERKRYSCSTFMMYLGLDGTEDALAHHTIYLADDYRTNLKDIETRHRLSEDPSIYVHNPAVTDPTMAPPGKSSIYVLVPVTHEHENVDWKRETPGFRRVVLRQLRKVGLHDVERRIRYEKILTPAGWRADMHLHRGATFSLAHSLDQMLHLRPRNRFEDLDGVYLTGGGTHPGSGLPVIYESAKITSRLLAEDLGLSHDWRESPPMAASSGALANAG